jgi:hypothetical protein
MLRPQAGAGEVSSKTAKNEGFEATKPPNGLGTIAILKRERLELTIDAPNLSLQEVCHRFVKDRS